MQFAMVIGVLPEGEIVSAERSHPAGLVELSPRRLVRAV
jgi:hypothetical protein